MSFCDIMWYSLHVLQYFAKKNSANILGKKSFLYDFHLKMSFSLLNKSLNINSLLFFCPLC